MQNMQKYGYEIPATLYHLTKKEKVKDIMSQGLKPRYGSNSALAECDERPQLFLCEKRDIGIWQILTGATAIIKIDTTAWDMSARNDMYLREYRDYDELIYEGVIPPQYLTRGRIRPKSALKDAHRQLAFGYTDVISDICFKLLIREDIHIMEEPCSEKEIEEFIDVTRCMISIMERIDFTSVTEKEYIETLQYRSNREHTFTFVDHYHEGIEDHGKRCFEHLPNITDCLKEPADMLYAFIISHYPEKVLYAADVCSFSIGR